jgi:phosphate acyltransferase
MTAGASQNKTAAPDVTISVDAMSGERGVAAVVAGMARAAQEFSDLRFIVCGDKTLLKRLIAKRRPLAGRCQIQHSDSVVGMDDKPSHVMRRGKGTSMWGAINALRDGHAAAAVSCGNTGALMAVSMLRLRKLPGVNRPAIAIFWPSKNPQGFNVMLDVGADVRAEPADLLQFALMGASYARNGLSLARPRIGLLNVGTEEHKGRAGLKKAYDLVEDAAERGNFEFVGFVEGGDIPSNRVDVIVSDGFTGNIALKTAEGTATFVRELVREAFAYSWLSRIGAMFAVTSLRRLTRRIDPRRVNGGVFLGLNGTVIKSHGDADATGVSAAIRLAYQLAGTGFTEKLAARVASAPSGGDDGAPDNS